MRNLESTGKDNPLGVGELFQISGTKNIIFWVALTVVVLVLLVVIAKLLPKSPPAS